MAYARTLPQIWLSLTADSKDPGIELMNNTQNKARRFVYFYFNRNEPEKIRQVAPAHVQY
jgi:hypothetical protein